MQFRAKDYRRQAAHCLRLAQQMRTVKAKERMTDVAATWEQLAQASEKTEYQQAAEASDTPQYADRVMEQTAPRRT